MVHEAKASNSVIQESHMASQERQVFNIVDEFLETGIEVENIRDIWYNRKQEFMDIPNDNAEWHKTVNGFIGDRLFELYLSGDFEIYNRLGIISNGLDSKYTQTPLVVFSEKQTRATTNACSVLSAGRYSSQGQIPNFEIVNIANYLISTAKDNLCAIVGITDYDPSGLNIWENLVTKLDRVLQVLNPDMILYAKLVSYGVDYDRIVDTYDTFELSKHPVNRIWRRDGHVLGVEMNVVANKQELLEELILKKIPAWLVETVSVYRAKDELRDELISASEEVRELQKKLDEAMRRIDDEVDTHQFTFKGKWGNELSYAAVRGMTV